MHIVLLAPDLRGNSGWSRAALDLAKGLKHAGHTVTALVSVASDSGVEEHVVLRPAVNLLGNPLAVLFDARRVRRALQRLQPDVVHAIAEPYGLLFPLLGHPRMRRVLTTHGSYAAIPFHYGWVTKWLMTNALRQCHRVIAVSEFTKRYLAEHGGEDLTRRAVVIPNMIDLTRFPQRRNDEKHDETYRVLLVGAVKERKGVLQAVEACGLLQKTHGAKLHFDVVGSLQESAEYVSKVRALIAKMSLGNEVVLHGSVDDGTLKTFFANADVFLMPSQQEGLHVEGFGIVFLEANALGIPVIGPANGGCPEAIRNGETGFVVDPKDPRAIAEALDAILSKRVIASASCRSWAEKHAVDNVIPKIVAAYGDY